jgi:hypothetical protein
MSSGDERSSNSERREDFVPAARQVWRVRPTRSTSTPDRSDPAASTASRNWPRLATQRIPRPPPPATALTKRGNTKCSAAACNSSRLEDGFGVIKDRQSYTFRRGDCTSLVAEQILDWVAHDAESALHPSCTAKMGIDPMFVTGPQRMGVHDEGGDLTLGNQPLAPATVPFYRHPPAPQNRSVTAEPAPLAA